MKKLAHLALVSAALGTAANAAPFLAIGDGAEIFVTGTLGVRADDNIFAETKATSDTIFDISPGVEITFGKDAQLKGALTLVDSFSNYSDNSKLNTNLFTGDFFAVYDDAKLKLKFNVGYHELNQNAPDIRGLSRRDQFVTGGSTEVEISQITSVGAGVSFEHSNYKRRAYADSDTLTVPLSFYYKWTPKLDLSLGYRYRDYQATIGQDSTDHFFSVGARGEFTPLLTGQISVGWSERKISGPKALGGGSQSLPGLDASLNYAMTPKTGLTFGGSNDYGSSPSGSQQKNFSLSAGVTTDISSEWKANAGISYRGIEYYQEASAKNNRTDDFVDATLGVTYVISTYVRFNASYTYRNNGSDLAASEFTQNVFSISASLRY